MFLHPYNALTILYLCMLFTFGLGDITCENAANQSPLLADCYAALAQIPNTDALVLVSQFGATSHTAGSFGTQNQKFNFSISKNNYT